MASSDDQTWPPSATDPREKKPIPKFEERVLNYLRFYSIVLVVILFVTLAIAYKVYSGNSAAQTLNSGAKVNVIKQTGASLLIQKSISYINKT